MKVKPKILAVDDEEFNLDIMTQYMSRAGYEVIGAEDGLIALQKLEQHPDIDVIVLDRMMPNMDGMQFLDQIKAGKQFPDVPIIMQTAAAASDQVLQGIKAGVYYYLTKPYDDEMLLSILKSAVRDSKNKKEMIEEVRSQRRMLGLMKHSVFHFRTLEDAKTLAYYIASCFPEPERVVFGLNELLINAVEHGNLGITYAEKTKLVVSGCWLQEVERRLGAPEYAEKTARLTFNAGKDAITVHIEDEGKGFDWNGYLELSPNRATDPHGRGIAASRIMSFDSLDYLGAGNQVMCKILLNQANSEAVSWEAARGGSLKRELLAAE